MSGRRLEQQYLKLLGYFGLLEVTTTLQELADQLCCTRRHMRSLLTQMHSLGWINWQAEPGRGRRSCLQLLRNEHQLLSDKADKLLDAGCFSEAIELLGEEKQLIAPLLRAKLGYSIRADHQTLRVPYYRTMPNLYPGTPLRRSELHLVRQIFNGLTRINEEKGEVEADLAHHWRMLEPLHWRFYLRPSVQFHDGRELCAADVVASLTRCAHLPLYSHIAQISQCGTLGVDIQLLEPDLHLPLLLSNIEAMILPADHASQIAFAAKPVGTGAYCVAENNDWHLRLKAFDHYFGLRALLDEVEILMWPELSAPQQLDESPMHLPKSGGDRAKSTTEISTATATWLSSSLSDVDYAAGLAASFTGKPSDVFSEMFLEKGGYFLLCDSRSSFWQGIEQRRWLREKLSPHVLLQQLIEPIRHFWVPTGSLLPTWFHCMMPCNSESPFQSDQNTKPVLRLAYHKQHPEYHMLTVLMTNLLALEGVELETVALTYTDWADGNADVDLWLGTVNFAVPEVWNVGCWLLGTPLLRQSISGGDIAQLKDWMTKWRNNTINAEELMRFATTSGWLQPLFHHWMRLKGPEQAKGIHLNNLGWFDFKSTWIEPEI